MENPTTFVASSGTDSIPRAAVDYACVLRAIGQDLSDLYPKIFAIDIDGANFTARGMSHPNPFQQQLKRRALAGFWRKFSAKNLAIDCAAAGSGDLEFSRSYTPESIAALDDAYSTKRTGQLNRPDNYSLAERLRSLGSIVSGRRGTLKQVRKDGDQLFADYWNEKGEVCTAKLTTVILYRNQQAAASGSGFQELWEGYDF